MEWIALLLFLVTCLALALGYPVAFTLGGVALWFALAGVAGGAISQVELLDIASRLFGTMTNQTLMAVPLFVFMGVMLERSRLAEQLLQAMGALFGRVRGGMLASVVLVGALLAASTGIVGATVVAMGLISLPTLLAGGINPRLASGSICAAGTLGQIIPPSIVLVLLGDVLSSAYQQAQISQGVWSVQTVSVGDLFAGALIPGLILVVAYLVYVLVAAQRAPLNENLITPVRLRAGEMAAALLPPVILIVAVLGAILGGFATATEAAGVGAFGSILLAGLRGRLSLTELRETARQTVRVTTMVFMILLGASMFAMTFSAYGGDRLVHDLLQALPGGAIGALLCVMLLMFLLGFVLDFIEIVFVVVPIVAPPLLMMGLDPIWLGVLMAMNLQTSFLTPPFGFALFYLRGVAPPEVRTTDIYRGAVPFIAIQVGMLLLIGLVPVLATWLPRLIYG
jgi:tripartite ATP-independent transporter DctM subunit